MTPLQERLHQIHTLLPESVQLVAVSKFHPIEALKEAYAAGQRIFGESRVQELQTKQPLMPNDVQWHFIGHLQANKVKYIVPYIDLIHAVDSSKLLHEIHRQGERYGRVVRCLLQVHVAQEDSKFGFSPEEFKTFLNSKEWIALPYAQLSGIMCMASNTDDEEQILQEFRTAQELFMWAKRHHFSSQASFCECSWGMSDDYPLALRTGSTLVRIGSKIFGRRS